MLDSRKCFRVARVLPVAVSLLLTIASQWAFGQATHIVSASDTNIQITGRVDKSDPDNVVFAFPGVSIKAKFEGTSIDALLTEYGSGSSTTTNYFNVIIDGGEPTVLKLASSQTVYSLASGLTDGVHTVELFKRTESSVGKVAFKGFRLQQGKKLVAPNPLPTRKIEFIGNSITCGYGNELSTTSPNNYHFTSANENNYKAWGAVAARSLNAQYSCVAYSGRGLFQNNTGTKTGTLPLMYDQVIADNSSISWDHYNYIPGVIVVNLGTNDFSAEVSSATYKVDSATFVNAYISFINKLRGYYPNASIICCVGVMMSDNYPSGGKHWTRIQNYVSSVKSYFNALGDSKIFYLKLEPQSSPYGEDWHPTAATDIKMADALTSFINSNISWTDCPASVNLGQDINLKYVQTPAIINTSSVANTGVTYSWYKNGNVLSGETSASYVISDSTGATGTYKVVRDSASCRYEDEVKVTNAIKTVGTICKWQDNKKAAVVLTFDDWSAGHPAIVVPELKKRGMVATFFPISNNISNWTSISNAALDGNEIGNHTKTHPDLSQYTTTAQFDKEVKFADSVINLNVKAQKVSTFDYPYGATNTTVIEYLKSMNYLGARGVQSSSQNYTYNFAPTVNDYYRILTYGMTGSITISSYASAIKSVINGGGLLTYLYHSVNSPTVVDNNYATVPQSSFQYQLDTLKSYSRKVWITTFSNALKYHREAHCASLVQVEAPTPGKWVVNLTDTITDSVLYNQPLTLILRLNGKSYDMIQQDGKILEVDSLFNDTIMFRATPNKGFITLSVSGITVQAAVSVTQCTNTVDTTITCTATATSALGIKQLVADVSAVGGASDVVMTATGNNSYSATFTVKAATIVGYKGITITATDNSGNASFAKTGFTITSGITVDAISVYQLPDSLGFSVKVTDDSKIASVVADLSPVKGTTATAFKAMAADSFYVSLPLQAVTFGAKTIVVTITDNTGNVVRLSKKFTVVDTSTTAAPTSCNEITFSPNPTKNMVYMGFGSLVDCEISVYNSLGTRCLTVNKAELSSNRIDVSSLPRGVYFFAVSSGGELVDKQTIVLK